MSYGAFGILGCGALTAVTLSLYRERRQQDGICRGVVDAIGNTPLIELPSLSKATGCTILVKAEHLNPGGSVKDRAAKMLLLKAEARGKLKRNAGNTIVEGTGGNTGVALAMLASSLGYHAKFAMPASIGREKSDIMERYGAQPAVGYDHPDHYYNVAKKLSQEPGHYGPDQFENTDNALAHYTWTALEMWQQSGRSLDGFVCASGTGGTMAGCSRFFKSVNADMKVYLIDPPGSGLTSYLETGVFKPLPGSTSAEGVGIMRLTANFAIAQVDGTLTANEQEIQHMMTYLAQCEGLYVGPSAALNVIGAVKLASKMGMLMARFLALGYSLEPDKGSMVATIICDGGDRYVEKLWKQMPDRRHQRSDLSFLEHGSG